jgi:hypothetical protein
MTPTLTHEPPHTGSTGPEQGVIEEARRRRRNRRARGTAVGLLALIIAGIAWTIGAGESHPALTMAPSHSEPLSGTIGQVHYRISVFPYLVVGWTGWCSSASVTGQGIHYGCEVVESSGPSVAGGDTFASQGAEYSYGIVSATVASVHWDGRIVRPFNNPQLPLGTRAYLIGGPSRQRGRLTPSKPVPLSPPTLFDAAGHQISEPQISRSNAVERLPRIAVNPRSPGTSRCAVRASHVAHLIPLSETVTQPVPWLRPQAGAFLACANATYSLDGATLGVAVLVDAANASRPAAPLPELQPDAAHRGLLSGNELGNIGFPSGLSIGKFGGGQAFETPTRYQEFTDHDVSARRAGLGWVIAEGGTPEQRARLLAGVSTSA